MRCSATATSTSSARCCNARSPTTTPSTASSAKSSRLPASVSAAHLTALRVRRFRQLPALRLRGPRAARAFVDDVGFCSTFYCFADGVPCLWGAVAELQQGLWIVKTEERYEPSFSYRWDLLENWLPSAVAAGRRLTRTAAARRLVERYVRAAVFTRPTVLRRLFGLSADEAAMT